MKPFPTQEIGSLPKFAWRSKPFRQMPLTDDDLETARQWGDRLQVEGRTDLYRLLSKRYSFSEEEKKTIVDFSLLYAIRMCETAGQGIAEEPGLDLVWSGEQARTEMYETPVSNIDGFEFVGRVRSFDNKYWRMASIRSPPRYKENYHLDEFLYTKENTSRRRKGPRDRRHHNHGVVGQQLLHGQVGEEGQPEACPEKFQRPQGLHSGAREDNPEGYPRAHREGSRGGPDRHPSGHTVSVGGRHQAGSRVFQRDDGRALGHLQRPQLLPSEHGLRNTLPPPPRDEEVRAFLVRVRQPGHLRDGSRRPLQSRVRGTSSCSRSTATRRSWASA